MANPNVSDIIASTLEARSGEAADNITNNNAILRWIKQAGGVRLVDGGRLIYEEILHTGNGNGGWFSGADVLPIAAADVLTAAEFAWKQYAVPVSVTGYDELVNSGKEAKIDLIAQRIKAARATMANDIATGLYSDGSGAGGKQLTGLLSAVPIDPTTGTYGGINRLNWTFWRSQVKDTNLAPDATKIQGWMNEVWAACTRGTDRPKLIMASSTAFAAYQASLQNLQRLTDPAKAKLGFSALQYVDADVVLDGGIGGAIQSDAMLFLNTDYLFFRPHKDRNMTAMNPEKRSSINQDVTVHFLGFMGNLTCSSARLQGRLIMS